MKKLAMVGCGAIAESFHLPALRALAEGRFSVVLVDPDPVRAAEMADSFGFVETADSHRQVLDDVDGAILATPHHLHVPIALEMVRAGVGVLSEKPLGTSVAEVEALRAAAGETSVVVAVNQTRRFIPACAEIRRVLGAGELGTIIDIDMAEGDKFGWPAATPSMFGARSGGRGVLLDIGVHALDLATWWFGAGIEVVSCHDDSFGGSEAAVDARFTVNGAPLSLRLSWLAKQANRYVIRGDRGTLTWSIYDLDRVQLSDPSGAGGRVRRVQGAPASFAELAPRVIDDFVTALESGTSPAVGVDDVLPSMRLIERCYEARRTFDMPWHPLHLEGAHVG